MEDFDGWRAQALENPALVADMLLRLRDVYWGSDPGAPPQEEAVSLPAGREVPPAAWGSRGRRSRVSTPPRMREAKEEDEPGQRSRASPMTPLDYGAGSGASESGGSGGEEGPAPAPASSAAKRSRPGEPAAARDGGGRQPKVVVVGEPAPLVFRTPDPKPIRRPTKKKTIPELQAAERSLLEQRGMLQKELEAQRRTHAALVAENRRLKRLKLSLESQSILPSTTAPMPEQVEPKQIDFVPLPDLNIPLIED